MEIGDTLEQHCEEHGPYAATFERRAGARFRGDFPAYGFTPCPKCKAAWDEENKKEKERLAKLNLPAESKPPQRNVDPQEQAREMGLRGRNVGPEEIYNLPPFNHGCGAYRR